VYVSLPFQPILALNVMKITLASKLDGHHLETRW
jgi:hypothetical protein